MREKAIGFGKHIVAAWFIGEILIGGIEITAALFEAGRQSYIAALNK